MKTHTALFASMLFGAAASAVVFFAAHSALRSGVEPAVRGLQENHKPPNFPITAQAPKTIAATALSNVLTPHIVQLAADHPRELLDVVVVITARDGSARIMTSGPTEGGRPTTDAYRDAIAQLRQQLQADLEGSAAAAGETL